MNSSNVIFISTTFKTFLTLVIRRERVHVGKIPNHYNFIGFFIDSILSNPRKERKIYVRFYLGIRNYHMSHYCFSRLPSTYCILSLSCIILKGNIPCKKSQFKPASHTTFASSSDNSPWKVTSPFGVLIVLLTLICLFLFSFYFMTSFTNSL